MSEGANRLDRARSAYLRSARHQPVWWQEWGEAAFELAARHNRPVLLDIGAVWCHWCHVMDRESYEDPETARLINEHFIAIKVDRDERPDVDARYQAAVAAISGTGGWPLTAFLTPEGQPFFGGTYFPPLDGHGRPGLRRVLMTMAESFEHRRDEVAETAASVMSAVEANEAFEDAGAAPDAALLGRMVGSTLGQFDPRFGGFGTQPKFPHPAALDLLLDTANRPGPLASQARRAAMVTLEKMSKGGICDHLAGGFHRYSVDERWVVPHFEKMSYDNSQLLRVYARAHRTTAEPECARVAREILGWVRETLSDRERGGFFASQDADVTPDDDGGYFTWTLAEAREVLSPGELAVAAPFYDIGELGDMPRNPLKNVLHVTRPLTDVARVAGVPPELAADRLRSARARLRAARERRPAPAVDRTMYTGWNALMVSAHLEAGRVFAEAEAYEFALRSLHRLLGEAWDGTRLRHVLLYGDGEPPETSLAGVLEDYALTGLAALDAWECTGAMRYFDAALLLAQALQSRFQDRERGGFYDTEIPDAGEVRLGALAARRKPLQDSPVPAGNAAAAELLLRLAELTGDDALERTARQTLGCFAGVVEHLGLYAASYGLALARLVLPREQVVILGQGADGDALERAALRGFTINRSVIRLREAGPLPPALEAGIGQIPGYGRKEALAVICRGQRCLPPVRSAEELLTALAQ